MNLFPNLQINFYMTPPSADTSSSETTPPSRRATTYPASLLNALSSMLRQTATPDDTRTTNNDVHFYVMVDPQSTTTGGLSTEDLQRYTRLRTNSSNVNTVCAICQNTMEQNAIVREIRSCQHSFHSECVDEWFIQHDTCPLCRTSIAPPPRRSSSDDSSSR